jgi:hypothetical protein
VPAIDTQDAYPAPVAATSYLCVPQAVCQYAQRTHRTQTDHFKRLIRCAGASSLHRYNTPSKQAPLFSAPPHTRHAQKKKRNTLSIKLNTFILLVKARWSCATTPCCFTSQAVQLHVRRMELSCVSSAILRSRSVLIPRNRSRQRTTLSNSESTRPSSVFTPTILPHPNETSDRTNHTVRSPSLTRRRNLLNSADSTPAQHFSKCSRIPSRTCLPATLASF